jgi:hypothetical protein
MGNAAAKMFKSYMDAKEMKCKIVDDEEERVIKAAWTLENTDMEIIFTFGEDNHDVHMQGYNFLRVSENNFDKMLSAVNECNAKYRWVKFTLDQKHGQIIAEEDAVISLDTCAEDTFELMIRMTQIVDEAYPIFMKAMWG